MGTRFGPVPQTTLAIVWVIPPISAIPRDPWNSRVLPRPLPGTFPILAPMHLVPPTQVVVP